MPSKSFLHTLISFLAVVCLLVPIGGCTPDTRIRPVAHYQDSRENVQYDLYEFQGRYLLFWSEDGIVTYIEKGRIEDDAVHPQGIIEKDGLSVFGDDLSLDNVLLLSQYGLDIYDHDILKVRRPIDGSFSAAPPYYREIRSCSKKKGGGSCYKACDEKGKCSDKLYMEAADVPVPDWYRNKMKTSFYIRSSKNQKSMSWLLSKDAQIGLYNFVLRERSDNVALFDDRKAYNPNRY